MKMIDMGIVSQPKRKSIDIKNHQFIKNWEKLMFKIISSRLVLVQSLYVLYIFLEIMLLFWEYLNPQSEEFTR